MNKPINKLATTIYSHTGLRGIAAMSVVLYHLGIGKEEKHLHIPLSHIFLFGGYAVDLFFVLSGFILNWVYLPGRVNWHAYLQARVARILPLYFLTTLIMSLLLYYQQSFPSSLVFTSNLLLVSGIINGSRGTLNFPAWSISVEFFCYLIIFPILVYLKNGLTNKAYAVFVSLTLACLSTFALVSWYHVISIPIWHWQWNGTWLLRGFFGFMTGFWLCSAYRERPKIFSNVVIANSVILVTIVIIFCAVLKIIPAYIILIAFPLLVLFSVTNQGFMAKILKIKLFQWLGERSYSIYLWHAILITSCYSFLTHIEYGIRLIIIALTLVISEASYRLFEVPCREYIRKFSGTSSGHNPGAISRRR